MNIFLSHSRKDSLFANSLKHYIENYYADSPFTVFMDEHSLLFGDKIKNKIRAAIFNSDIVIVVLSPSSLESDWVKYEITTALRFETTIKRTVILPLVIKPLEIPQKLKHRLFIDCTNAKIQEINLHKLMRDLSKFGTAMPFQTDKSYQYNKYFEQSVQASLPGKNNYITVRSPMIGTFYRNAGPGKRNFIEIGSVIRAGDVLCIIEAMKLFNEIESEVKGRIVEILIEDASPVEYDQAMFLVEPV